MKLAEVAVELPYLKGKWIPDNEQRKAAWEMYVELVTRVSIQPLGPGEGLLREALSSLHEVFDETRRILKAHGPDVATRIGEFRAFVRRDRHRGVESASAPVLKQVAPVLAGIRALRPDHSATRARSHLA